jgi:transposase
MGKIVAAGWRVAPRSRARSALASCNHPLDVVPLRRQIDVAKQWLGTNELYVFRQSNISQVLRKGYRRYLKVQGDHHFAIDQKQIKTEARYDGLWVLRTNTLYNAETAAHVYKALWTVEDIIRTTKSIMDTRPIYHRCNQTIRGHVFCSFLALLLKTELERRMKFADSKCEWAQVIRGLAALQQVEVAFQDKRFVLRSQLTSEASAVLRATGVAVPPICWHILT